VGCWGGVVERLIGSSASIIIVVALAQHSYLMSSWTQACMLLESASMLMQGGGMKKNLLVWAVGVGAVRRSIDVAVGMPSQ